MTTRRPSPLQLALLSLPALVAALAAARAAGTGGTEFPVASVIAILGVLYVLVVAAALFGAFERPVLLERFAEGARALAEAARSLGIPLTDRLLPPRRAATVTVVAVGGECPLGLRTGRRWRIRESGRLDAQICQPAATAVDRLARGAEAGAPATAACVCPRGAQTVTFALNTA